MPQHHLHIGGFTIFCALAFVLLLVWLLRRPKTIVKHEREVVFESAYRKGSRIVDPEPRPMTSPWASPPPYPHHTSAAYAAAPAPVVVHSGGNDMLTGVLLGEAMAGGFNHHETVIERDHYSDYGAAPSYDAPSTDSGISYSDSGSSYSDSGSSGVDFSW